MASERFLDAAMHLTRIIHINMHALHTCLQTIIIKFATTARLHLHTCSNTVHKHRFIDGREHCKYVIRLVDEKLTGLPGAPCGP